MNNKKVLAFYLPQFHAIPENDEWWGKGFTEWRNTKKAKPLFSGHRQPRTPLNENYYNLLDSETQIWQSELAQKYGVYGFCYYHYWFTGKLLLEKPMENMLKDSRITIPFCISWANESWARTWDGNDKEYLIHQNYGGEEDWEAHLQYLLPFFRDKRYIKIEGKPLFLLYTACNIERCEEMIDYWQKRMQEEGFEGIYILETLNGIQKEHVLGNSEGDVVFEPIYTRCHEVKKNDLFSKIKRYLNYHYGIGKVARLNTKDIYRLIEEREYSAQRKTYIGTFPDWDNTARKGNRGIVFTNSSPEIFKKHLEELFHKSNAEEFIFINAWNEWGEGAYLEPDQHYEYRYLEAIAQVNAENN